MYPRLLLLSSIALFLVSCGNEEYTQQAAPLRIDSMDMSEVVVALPEGPEREQVEISCVPCHSLRYIQMQPPMTHKAWDKIVTKMIKVYGAPVRDSATARLIVNYLTSIKGIEDRY